MILYFFDISGKKKGKFFKSFAWKLCSLRLIMFNKKNESLKYFPDEKTNQCLFVKGMQIKACLLLT